MSEPDEEVPKSDQPEPTTTLSSEGSHAPQIVVWIVLVGIALFAGYTLYGQAPGDTIKLSGEERDRAVALFEHRQAIQIKRQEVTAEFQAAMNRLAEEENGINIENQKQCFALNKSHKLDPAKHYRLDEYRGELVRDH